MNPIQSLEIFYFGQYSSYHFENKGLLISAVNTAKICLLLLKGITSVVLHNLVKNRGSSPAKYQFPTLPIVPETDDRHSIAHLKQGASLCFAFASACLRLCLCLCPASFSFFYSSSVFCLFLKKNYKNSSLISTQSSSFLRFLLSRDWKTSFSEWPPPFRGGTVVSRTREDVCLTPKKTSRYK